jgi:hypothetical protein
MTFLWKKVRPPKRLGTPAKWDEINFEGVYFILVHLFQLLP